MKNKKAQEELGELCVGFFIGVVCMVILWFTFFYHAPTDISYRSTYNLSNGEIINCDRYEFTDCGGTFNRCFDINKNPIENITYKCQTNFKIIKDCRNGCKIKLIEADE